MPYMDLPFATIIKLREDIAEVIINEGVEMNLDMVNQYHEYLLLHFKAPFSLLINKVNSYTYNFFIRPIFRALEFCQKNSTL